MRRGSVRNRRNLTPVLRFSLVGSTMKVSNERERVGGLSQNSRRLAEDVSFKKGKRVLYYRVSN